MPLSHDRAQQAQSQHQQTANTVSGVVATLGNRSKTHRFATLVLAVLPYLHASRTAVTPWHAKQTLWQA